MTLWARAVDRVDCTTRRRRLRPASDRLLRLRWPADVPGGAAGQRGRRRGRRPRLRHSSTSTPPSTRGPWTTRRNTWFGRRLDRAASRGRRRAATRASASPRSSSPTPDDRPACATSSSRWSAPGVTATTSTGHRPRYGALGVDSNLPDVRDRGRRPRRATRSPRRCWTPRPAYAAELDRQLADDGRARVWVPARRPLAEVWVPSADLRGVRALPVLVVVGTTARPPRLTADLPPTSADAAAGASARCRPRSARTDDETVALLNRGLPGFAVDPTGALHLSLTALLHRLAVRRSGSTRRAARPRTARLPAAALDAHLRVRARVGAGRLAGGRLRPGRAGLHRSAGRGRRAGASRPAAAAHSLLAVDPPGAAVVTAVKPVGAPLASGPRRRRRPRRSPSGCTRRTAARSPRGCGWPAAWPAPSGPTCSTGRPGRSRSAPTVRSRCR